jgi:hypothetical protein
MQVIPSTIKDNDDQTPWLCDMSDSDQLFNKFPTHLNDIVKAPLIFNNHQNLILPTEYDSKLLNESFVIIEVF